MTLNTKFGPLALPCLEVKVVPMDKVIANNYNPNHVSDKNMELLHTSINDNGVCYAVVTIYDEMIDRYIIVDGFHRYTDLKDKWEATECPVIVLDHDIKQRMAATVQFNRARGVHQVELMGDLVQALVEQGAADEEIAEHLGMDPDEVYRLKQVTGIAALFKNQAYSKSWKMMEVPDDEL